METGRRCPLRLSVEESVGGTSPTSLAARAISIPTLCKAEAGLCSVPYDWSSGSEVPKFQRELAVLNSPGTKGQQGQACWPDPTHLRLIHADEALVHFRP